MSDEQEKQEEGFMGIEEAMRKQRVSPEQRKIAQQIAKNLNTKSKELFSRNRTYSTRDLTLSNQPGTIDHLIAEIQKGKHYCELEQQRLNEIMTHMHTLTAREPEQKAEKQDD